MKMPNIQKHRKMTCFICVLCLTIAFLCFFCGRWYVNTYGRIGFDAVLYTVFSDISGVEPKLIWNFLINGVGLAFAATAVVSLVLFFRGRKKIILHIGKWKLRIFPFAGYVSCGIVALLTVGLMIFAAIDVELTEYIYNVWNPSTFYDEYYVDPESVQISFPDKKRNLIYLYLESMETTFLSEDCGGGLPYTVIPELYQLASENVNFSHNKHVGGFRTTSGSHWTIGALVSHYSGIPLKTPPGVGGNLYGENEMFLPGLVTLNDILRTNGYYQALMVGSDATFGGREAFYLQHGMDRIYDHATAQEDGIIEPGYEVWWGFEDLYLYEYAKQELLKIAEMGQPFSFTLLTADTHHVDGYKCALCGDEYASQYENVLACSSRQAYSFIQWLWQQDFYENTTVVIVGDHPTMDNEYITSYVAEGSARRVYNCIINASARTTDTRDRVFGAIDMFPTTLAAMGCDIEGNRLGLGTNLFSEERTLMEEMGFKNMNAELGRFSKYYADRFY